MTISQRTIALLFEGTTSVVRGSLFVDGNYQLLEHCLFETETPDAFFAELHEFGVAMAKSAARFGVTHDLVAADLDLVVERMVANCIKVTPHAKEE
ncbi:hypothetical protein [Ensifer sp. MJa1]|uniref:hypothetical protein n=1 Tax=Ensifer sp. MJa1 TaxID=2919888 RepID=UPI0030087611